MDAKQKHFSPPAALDEKVNLHIELEYLPLADALEEFEKHYIARLIAINHGHKGKTAAMLRIDRKTLYRKLKKYGVLEEIWNL